MNDVDKALDLMTLTPGERRLLEQVKAKVDDALRGNHPDHQATVLQEAEDILRRITRRQFWSLR